MFSKDTAGSRPARGTGRLRGRYYGRGHGWYWGYIIGYFYGGSYLSYRYFSSLFFLCPRCVFVDWEACTFQESGKITCVREGEWCASLGVVESGEEAIGVAVVEKVLGKRALSELDGAGGRVACFSVGRSERERNTSFSRTFSKSRKLRSPRQVENLRAERSSNANNPQS